MGFRRYVSLWAGLAACLFLLRQFAPAIAQERPPEFEEMYQRGLALYEAGKYAEAIPIAQQYIEVAAARYGEQHSWYATGLGYLAILYQAQNRFAEAEPLFKSALAIKEETLGPDHFEVGDALHALAELCRKQGRLPEAEPLYHRALSIAEKVLGPEHPSTGTVLNNLAEVYRAQGRHAEAEPLAKRSLAIREKASGSAQSSGGRLGADELASLAELELELGRERRAAAREARRARGQNIGRPKALDKSKSELARRMHTSGEPVSTIAATLGVSRATVYRALAHQSDEKG